MENATPASCLNCVLRPERVFCDLPGDALADFDSIKSVAVYPRGALLFRQGEPARSIFLICSGRVKLTLSEAGKQLMLRVAMPGEVLGLSGALSAGTYEVIAEALTEVQVSQVSRKNLVRFLHDHRQACLQVVNLISQDLHIAYERVRAVGLGRSHRRHFRSIH